jgi:EmrB/QacA subfamily drug resistance transporter
MADVNPEGTGQARAGLPAGGGAGTAAPERPGPAASGMTHRQIMIVLSTIMLSMLLAALGQNGVATALPTIAGKLGGLQDLSWVVTAYLLAMTAATPLYGKLSDLYGSKPMLLFADSAFVVGSLAAGLSQNMGELIASRALQGVGAGGVIAMGFTMMTHIVPPRETGRYHGYNGITWSVATVAGPLVGGALTQHASWRWVFFINVPVGLLALGAAVALLKVPVARQQHRVDYIGTALIVGAVGCLLLVTVWGGQNYPWSSAIIVGLIAAGVVLAVLFIVRERYAREPILALSLFRAPLVGVAFGVIFLVGLAMFAAGIFLPMYLQVVKAISPTNAGVFLLPMWFSVTAASFITGWLIAKTGKYKIFIIIGSGLIALSMYLFSGLGLHTSDWVVVGDEILMGCGLGSVISKLIMSVQNVVDRKDLGSAVSATQFFRELGGALGTAIFGAVLAARLSYLQPRMPAVEQQERAHLLTGKGAALYKDPQSIDRLRHVAPALYHGMLDSLVQSLHTVYLVALPLAGAAFLLTWFLPKPQLQDLATWQRPPHQRARS